jgi:hypothetical protein
MNAASGDSAARIARGGLDGQGDDPGARQLARKAQTDFVSHTIPNGL